MKTKEWTIRATMDTDLIGTIRTPADWTEEQVWEWLGNGNSADFAGTMSNNGSGWNWSDVHEARLPDPDAFEVEEYES